MKKTTKKLNKKEVNQKTDDFLNDVVDDDKNFSYVPYVSTFDLNDYNTQSTLSLDSGIKDELNDIKNLLKSMNDNLDKILHHLNGGWN